MSKSGKSKKEDVVLSSNAIIPSREADWTELEEEPLELGRTVQGKLYEKHILNMGELIHPKTGTKINIDRQFVDTLKRNFEDKVCDIVQVPLAGARNEHTEDPTRNIGEVVDIRDRDGKVYAVIDVRDDNAAKNLGKTLLGVSAMLSTNYVDTRIGKPVGPTLLHACVTNRPYVTGLEDYKEIVAASADSAQEDAVVYVSPDPLPEEEEDVISATSPTQEENVTMTREEMIAALKAEHGIDVAALQTAAEEAESVATLTNTFNEAIAALEPTGTLVLSNGNEVTADALVNGIKEVVELTKAQGEKMKALEKVNAEAAVDKLVETGYVLPTQRDALVTIKLTNEDMFTALIPAEPVVKLSVENGQNPTDTEKSEAETQATIDELSARWQTMFASSKKK